MDYLKYKVRSKPDPKGSLELRFTPQSTNINNLKTAVTGDLKEIHTLLVTGEIQQALLDLMELNIKFTDVAESLKLSKEFSMSQEGAYRLNEVTKLIKACRDDLKTYTMLHMNEANNAV